MNDLSERKSKLRVLIVSGSRADYSGLGMVARELRQRGHVLALIALQTGFDRSAVIHEDGLADDVLFVGSARRAFLPAEYANALLYAVNAELTARKWDVVLLAGDRYEILAAALAASMHSVPIVHLGGGDVTHGSADNRYRDAISALASLHCVNTEAAQLRLTFETHRGPVVKTGSPALDRMKLRLPRRPAQLADWHFDGEGKALTTTALVQVHSNTSGTWPYDLEAAAVIAALRGVANPVFLSACADPGGDLINDLFRRFCDTTAYRAVFIENVEPCEYYWLLAHCDVMVGNSSAAFYEAPLFGIPVVNVGDRQEGRPSWFNVMNAQPHPKAIERAIIKALQRGRGTAVSPYGDGCSAPRVVDAIEQHFSSNIRGSVTRETSPEAVREV